MVGLRLQHDRVGQKQSMAVGLLSKAIKLTIRFYHSYLHRAPNEFILPFYDFIYLPIKFDL
jgi:hypothetical protein